MNKTDANSLPQGGTSCLAAGESATVPSGPSSPSYSGGGNECLCHKSPPSASGSKSRGGSRPESPAAGTKATAKFWRRSSPERRRDADSDSVSSGSVSSGREGVGSATENAERFRKRPRTEESSSNGGLTAARKVPRSGRGKGARGRRFASQEAGRRAAKDAGEGSHLSRRVLSSESSDCEPEAVTGGGSNQERMAGFEETMRAAIRDVALKRTFESKSKAIVAASASILAAAETLSRGPPPSDEVSALRAEVARLATAVERLQKENGRLRADQAKPRAASPEEVRERGQGQPPAAKDRVLDLIRQELGALRADVSVMQGIVLRPSLGANKKTYADATAGNPKAGPSSQPDGGAAKPDVAKGKAPAQVQGKAPAQVKGKAPAQEKSKVPAQKKGKAPAQKKAAAAKAPVPAADPPPTPPTPPKPPEAEDGWHVAGEKQRGRKAAQKARRAERKRRHKKRSAAAKMRAPKTAAVVITLQPDAASKGMLYRDVLAKLKATVDLEELGITGGLRVRVTATGARMMEIPGESSASSADALAEKLRASLNADEVRVSRPIRCATLRILGLDDSVSEEEVLAAVTAAGGCSAELVKAGTLRPDREGMLTVTVSCPVTAAKKIAEGHTLKVGWSRVQVKLLEPRPLRCFRCHVGHHVGCRCTSEVDRSELCFRCGQPGHKAAACLATPHCDACAAAGKPAEHRAGGKACTPPAKAQGKGRPSATTNPTVANAAAAAAAAAAANAATATPAAVVPQEVPEGAEMDCH